MSVDGKIEVIELEMRFAAKSSLETAQWVIMRSRTYSIAAINQRDNVNFIPLDIV